MSSEKGNGSRTRTQKYKNRTAFKNDLHDKTPKQIMLNHLNISEVCTRCKEVLEWKIRYKKYKPLSQAKTCTKCHERNIKKAYHVLCRGCAIQDKVCAKCLKSSEAVDIIPAEPSTQEQIKLKVEMDRLIKSLPERKRRAFLRYMEKGKKVDVEEKEQESADDAGSNGEEDEEKEAPKTIPHSRDDLLKKIDELKLATSKNKDDDSDIDDFSDSDFDDY